MKPLDDLQLLNLLVITVCISSLCFAIGFMVGSFVMATMKENDYKEKRKISTDLFEKKMLKQWEITKN